MPLQTKDLFKLPDSDRHCPHCQLPMKEAGDVALPDVPFSGGTAAQGVQWSKFDVYICPKCGKSEFFF